jgi:small subunit ribosomal protein S14
MARKGLLESNARKRELVKRYASRRLALVTIMKDPAATPLEKREAQAALSKLPRNSSATRVRNRCNFTGRPRAFLRDFGTSRIAFREMSLRGLIPGVRKSSW